MNTTFHSDSATVRDTIRRCCQTTADAKLVVPESGMILRVLFSSFTDEHLIMRVECGDSMLSDLIMTNAYVSFSDDAWSCFFFASIVHVEDKSEDVFLLTMSFPDAITAINARKTHRVPVGPQQALVLTIKTEDGRYFDARARNIGLTGMMAEIVGDRDPEFTIGQLVEVLLKDDDNRIRLNGQVRRRQHKNYGLLFPSCIDAGIIEAPDQLCRLVRRLERSWIREHAV